MKTENDSNVTIRSCYSLDQQDVGGNTALIYAIGEGNREIATTLLTPHEETSHCAKITVPNAAGLTPLHIAAQKGYAECVEHLLRLDESDIDADHKNEHDSSLINMQDKEGNTPLLHAAQHGHYLVIEILLDRPNKTGADPFLANMEGVTPLMAACRIGHNNMVIKLIQTVPPKNRRRFVNQRDGQDRNALHYILQSISQNKIFIIEELQRASIEIDQEAIALADHLSNERQEVLKLLQVSGS